MIHFQHESTCVHRRLQYLAHDTVPLKELDRYLAKRINNEGKELNEAELLLLGRHLQRVRFYLRLESFGYELTLKPVKLYEQDDGTTRRKANCDVDMTFRLMKERENFDRAVILSGDGDFLPVLKHLRDEGKEIVVLARGPRTAREIRQFAGSNFRDFVRLETTLKFDESARKSTRRTCEISASRLVLPVYRMRRWVSIGIRPGHIYGPKELPAQRSKIVPDGEPYEYLRGTISAL